MQTDCFPDAASDRDKKPIGKLATINPRYKGFKGREYPFIEMAAVAEQFGGIQYITTRNFEGSGLARFKVGDTLFAKITPCPENGKVAFVGDLPDELGIGSTEFIVLSPRECCDPRFLYHLACCHDVRGRAIGRMEGSTGRQRVPDDAFKKRLIVPVPSPEEQSAIARILDAVDTAIERTQDAVDRARDLQTSLTSELIDKLGAPLRRLAEFATDVRYGTSNASNTNGWGHPALRIPNVLRGELSVDDLSYVEVKAADSQRLMLRDGDLLLVRTNGNPHYVGRSVVFHPPDGRHWIYASYLIRVRLGEGLSPEYANLVLGLERGRRELLRRVTTSAGNCNINSNSIRLVRLPVPRLESDQKRVVEAAHAVRAVQEAHLVELSALHDLKRALMHDLLTGKVRTDQLALDEVAA